jgi:hypothetical protein
MNNPELIAVPVLMLLDYALTIVSVKKAGVYRQHFEQPYLELNPSLRKRVAERRWFNPRHLLTTTFVAVVLVAVDQALPPRNYSAFQVLLGVLLGTYSSVCGRHLSNLLMFRYLNRNPTEISGRVVMSSDLCQKFSVFYFMGATPPLIVIVILAPAPYAIGVLMGVLFIIPIHWIWARAEKTAKRKVHQAEPQEQAVENDSA